MVAPSSNSARALRGSTSPVSGLPARLPARVNADEVYVTLPGPRLRDETHEKADHLAPVVQHEAGVPEVPEEERQRQVREVAAAPPSVERGLDRF